MERRNRVCTSDEVLEILKAYDSRWVKRSDDFHYRIEFDDFVDCEITAYIGKEYSAIHWRGPEQTTGAKVFDSYQLMNIERIGEQAGSLVDSWETEADFDEEWNEMEHRPWWSVLGIRDMAMFNHQNPSIFQRLKGLFGD